MSESDQESTCNTDDLISGIHRLDDISPLVSPRDPPDSTSTSTAASRKQQIMSSEVNLLRIVYVLGKKTWKHFGLC